MNLEEYYGTKESWFEYISNEVLSKRLTPENSPFLIKVNIEGNDKRGIKHELIKTFTADFNEEQPLWYFVNLDPQNPRNTEVDTLVWNTNWIFWDEIGFPSSLEGINLTGKSLNGIDLSFAYLGSDKLKPEKPDHSHADFSNSKLLFTNFSYSNMESCNFSSCRLSNSFFIGCELKKTKFISANLDFAIFDNANLENVDFTGASLRGASFLNARLTNAVLDHADLSGCKFLEVDGNFAYQTTFPKTVPWFLVPLSTISSIFFIIYSFFSKGLKNGSKRIFSIEDKWTLLREEYTGVKGSMILIFTLFFVTPYIIKAILYKGIGSLELQTKILVHAKEYQVWEIILGLDKNSLSYTTLVVLLIVYNLLRYFLTSRISKLKEREIRNQKTPRLEEYRQLFSLHLIVLVLSLFSLIFLIYNIINLLFSKVYLP